MYSSYKVPNPSGGTTEVIVGGRWGLDTTDSPAWALAAADAFISVTDTQVPFPLGTPYHWLPWVERRPPTRETLYAALRLLDYYVRSSVKRIYLHCDAGTHRSPTIFGAYLVAYFGRDVALRIQEAVVMHEKTINSEPLYYLDTYLTRGEINLSFLEWISGNPTKRLEEYRPEPDQE